MLSIYKKELKSYFLSPIGYVAIGIFLFIFSLIFLLAIFYNGAYDMGNLYYNTARFGLLIIIPIISMRMFSEERKNGTEQLLLTSPRSITEIILGKFLAAATLIVIILAFSLMYYVILCFFTKPSLGPTLIAMLGFLLVAMAAISAGMFISSITENQVIAAVLTFVLLFIPDLTGLIPMLNLLESYMKFPAGLVSLSEVVSLLAYMIMFTLFTIIIMQRRKSVK